MAPSHSHHSARLLASFSTLVLLCTLLAQIALPVTHAQPYSNGYDQRSPGFFDDTGAPDLSPSATAFLANSSSDSSVVTMGPPSTSSSSQYRVVDGIRYTRMDKRIRYPTCTKMNNDSVTLEIGLQAVGTKWRGWGTSLAWAGRFLGGLTQPFRRKVMMDLIFHKKKGIGFNLVRYAIPGGYAPRFSPKIWKQDKYRGYSPRKGVFNWGGDWKQVLALKEARQRGNIEVDAICYSPPWWMTLSKDASGNVKSKPNLMARHYPTYADYLATVIAHFQNQWGIQFAGISPFNEALEAWWHKGGYHEGCTFDAPGMHKLNFMLRQGLQSKKVTKTRIVGVDSWPGYTVNALRKSLWPLGQAPDVISVHGYRSLRIMSISGDESEYKAIRDEARKHNNTKIWQTEWGPLHIAGTPLEIAVYMARSIAQHINIMGVEAWYHWLPVQSFNRANWGPIQAKWKSFGPIRPKLTKQFFGMLHFTRWIHRGSYPLFIRNECKHSIVAAYSPKARRLSVTIANQQSKEFRVNLKISGFDRWNRKKSTLRQVRRTSLKENYKRIYKEYSWDAITSSHVTIQGNSITTVGWTNVAMLGDPQFVSY
ncbi:unnamed protein product [Closterium sp. Yama58-4]|nr:unnamed protein product [Closterium sp. Yama58-4]